MFSSSTFDFTVFARIRTDPSGSAMVVPSELKACVSVRREDAVSGLPSTAT